jgi:Arc/MetJ-type ribon-helix-helix transcriptional regulator
MQIAITIADEVVDELDNFVPDTFRSRSEVVRHAVNQWLASERAAEIDRRFIEAYDLAPQSVDDIDQFRVGSVKPPQGWADLQW